MTVLNGDIQVFDQPDQPLVAGGGCVAGYCQKIHLHVNGQGS